MKALAPPWATGRSLVLASGGLDSTALMHALKANGHAVEALFIGFDQPSLDREWHAVRKVTEWLEIPLSRVDVNGLDSSFTRGIPGRNGFLVHVALLHRAPYSGLIAIGLHADPAYSDAGPPFVAETQGLIDLYNGGVVQLAAPFLDWPKGDIWRYALSAGLPVEDTYSCDLGLEQPCGRCASCADVAALHARS